MTAPRITIAYGDGIGPEIMGATLGVLEAAGAKLSYDVIEIGMKAYERGLTAGIADSAWQSLIDNKIFLKAPVTTPQGGGFKSLNVTVRKTLGLYANVRPCTSYSPFVRTKHPKMDLVIVRENEEDLYAGIEHRQTDEVYQCLKLITRPGCEKIVRYAFEYAKRAGRKKVSCFTKDNIMKMTDGLFHRVFDEIGEEYPGILKEHMIVDIGAARIADTPEIFDVVVMPNLYGDILSDVAAQIAGSVGLAGSSNIGENCSMFEAIHGSAPDLAGKGIANPSGLILASVQMLLHMGQDKVASRIHNAWLKTIEDGIHTGDVYQENLSKKRVGTADFAAALVERLDEKPTHFSPVAYLSEKPLELRYKNTHLPATKTLVGVDVFVQENDRDPQRLGARLQMAIGEVPLQLTMITNRGVKVYPQGMKETFCTDHWRCRFEVSTGGNCAEDAIWMLMRNLKQASIETIKTENLYLFDGQRGYSLGQGQ